MCLQIARALRVAPIEDYPIGTIFLSPIEDIMSFGFGLLDRFVYALKRQLLGTGSLDPLNVPESITELFRSYGHTYFNRKKKVFDPFFTNFFQDPVVSLLWWLQFSHQVMNATRHLGA